MAEVQTYSGGCHCGAVRYRVQLALDSVLSCNCSICMKRGSLLTFTSADNFELQSGEDALTDYQFNKHIIHHLFCTKCGILSFARGTGRDGTAMVAVNARCLDGFEPSSVKITEVNNRG